jgi:hypothetical protein
MKVVTLPDVLHEYLVHVLLTYHAHPEEGVAMANLWEACAKKVTHIDDKHVQETAKAGTPAGQSSPAVDPRNPQNRPIECQECFDEEGSLACIRPAHQKRNMATGVAICQSRL